MSVGFFNFISIYSELRVNTFYGREKELLIAFKNLLKTHFNKAPHFLSLTAYVIGIPSLKNNIDCSKVASIYYKVNKIDRIAIYFKKKLINITKVFLIMCFERLLVDTEIIY
mgnify:CR=1 FL=1